jgi:hypothetical protein
MTLQIDGFGREALDAYASRAGSAAPDVVRTATLYYLADRALERPAWRIPRFTRELVRGRGTALDVEFDEDTFGTLEQEANRQGVAAERLAEHALLYFLADSESGRLVSRLENALGEEA